MPYIQPGQVDIDKGSILWRLYWRHAKKHPAPGLTKRKISILANCHSQLHPRCQAIYQYRGTVHSFMIIPDAIKFLKSLWLRITLTKISDLLTIIAQRKILKLVTTFAQCISKPLSEIK